MRCSSITVLSRKHKKASTPANLVDPGRRHNVPLPLLVKWSDQPPRRSPERIDDLPGTPKLWRHPDAMARSSSRIPAPLVELDGDESWWCGVESFCLIHEQVHDLESQCTPDHHRALHNLEGVRAFFYHVFYHFFYSSVQRHTYTFFSVFFALSSLFICRSKNSDTLFYFFRSSPRPYI